jgi:hypothetical protein
MVEPSLAQSACAELIFAEARNIVISARAACSS